MRKKLLLLATICGLFIQCAYSQLPWLTIGNAGTVDGTHFIGTTDNIPFNIRVNNQKAGRIDHLLRNTSWGYLSGFSTTTGNDNTALGNQSLYLNSTGYQNVGIGSYALSLNTTGYRNTALGYNAGVSSGNLTNATAIGANAIVSQSNSLVLGNNANVGIGTSSPTAKLEVAGQVKITGGSPGIGKVLTSDASGLATWQIPGSGSGTGWSLTGNAGTVDGTHFIGTTDNIPLTIRANNQTAGRIDHLLANAFWGYQAGIANTTGTQNTIIGHNANVSSGALTNATAIGANATVSTSNSLVLGNNVNVGIGTSAPSARLEVAGQVKITGGLPGAGKILTSDASGLATWETPAPVSSIAWKLTGNAGTVDGTNFIGTTDNVPLSIRVNNQQAGRIDASLANAFFGYEAGLFNTTGGDNTVNGHHALFSNTVGGGNTATGYKALNSNTTGNNNTAIGSNANVGSGTLTNATAIGANATVSASNSLVLGNNVNVGIGTSAPGAKLEIAGQVKITGGAPGAGKVLTSDAAGLAVWATPLPTTGAIGWALVGNAGTIDGTNFIGTTDNVPFTIRVNNQKAGRIDHILGNTFMGYQTGLSTTSGANTAYGFQSLYTNTIGYNNTAIGYRTLYSNTQGLFNTASGYNALYSNTLGNYNTANGSSALYSNTTGGANTALGDQSLYSNTDGDYNTALGRNTLYLNATGSYNVAVGNDALFLNNTGSYNTAMGYSALYSNSIGDYNTAIGMYALKSNTSGGRNTANGYYALSTNTTGSYNSAFGMYALFFNTTGVQNTATGNSALYQNTTGINNTATGNSALFSNTSGHTNTATGEATLLSNTTGFFNTATGSRALQLNTTGSNNTANGYNTMNSNTTGSNNTALGYQANVSTGALTNATVIGNGAIVNASNKIRLGNASVTAVEGPVAYTVSDARFKSNIEEKDVKGLEFIKLLRPVAYNYEPKKFQEFLIKNMPDSVKERYRTDMDKNTSRAASIRQTGFIAQEMEEAMKVSGYDFNGLHSPENEDDNYSIAYGLLTVPLVKAVQEQQKMIEEKDAEMKDLKTELAAMKKQMEKLEQLFNQGNTNSGNTTIVELSSSSSIILNQNEPNPFAEQTTITYTIPEDIKQAQILFYDATGRIIKTVEIMEKGRGALQIYASNLSSGIYTYSIVADGKLIDTKKMMKAK